MKHQNSCGPRWGKLVHQLPGVINFTYDLYLGSMIAHWKYIDKEIHLGGSIKPLNIIEVFDHEKTSFRPSKWPQYFRNRKTAKISKLPKKLF
jgi:hypothetical protein